MAQPQPRWTTAGEVAQVDLPPGGSTGQVLAKTSDADREVAWTTVAGTGDVVGPASATTDNLAVFADETGKLLKDGGPPGGGGSFLSANTARVDPSGDDDTGTVGDLSKPFFSVQAAVDALAVANNDTSNPSIVLLPSADLGVDVGGDVTVDLANIAFTNGVGLHFIGSDRSACSIRDVTVTGFAGTEDDFSGTITFINCHVNAIVGNADTGNGHVVARLEHATVGLVTTEDSEGSVNLRSDSHGYITNGITSGLNVYINKILPNRLFGYHSPASIGASDADYVGVFDAAPTYDSYSWPPASASMFTIVAANADIMVVNSVLENVTCTTGTFRDSRAIGTITGLITYDDILLKGVPPGGTAGDDLKKLGSDDFVTEWVTPSP